MSVLSVPAIRDRLAARLPLPGAGPRDAPARQRTLDGAIGWSIDLLTADEQAALLALAVFEGGFDVEQASSVIGASHPVDDGLERVLALAEHSLISRDPGSADQPETSSIRFAMIKTVQDVALRRLADQGTEGDARRRHAMAFLDLTEVAASHLFAAGQPVWLDRLGLDHSNIRAAMRWAVDTGEEQSALRFAGALWRFWQLEGHLAEGRVWTEAALTMPGADAPTKARMNALASAGGLAYWYGDQPRAHQMYRAQLEVAEQIGDEPGMADAWFNLASTSYLTGDQSEANRAIHEARRRFEALGDDLGVNRANWGISNLAMLSDGPPASYELVSQVLDRAIELGDTPYVALAVSSMAWLSYSMGDVEAASRWSLRGLWDAYQLRDVSSTTIGLDIAAIVAHEVDRPEDAAVLLGAFEGLSERYGVKPPLALADLMEMADPYQRARDRLEPEIFEAALERGRRMSLETR